MIKKWEVVGNMAGGKVVVMSEGGFNLAILDVLRWSETTDRFVYLVCNTCCKKGEPVTFEEFLNMAVGQRSFICIDCDEAARERIFCTFPPPNTEPKQV